MVDISYLKTRAFFTQHGKLGFSGGLGRIALGYNRLGFYSLFCGIYQKKYKWGKPYISRQKFYAPTDPKTEGQLASRQRFADGMALWSALPPETKKYYDDWGKRFNKFGWNMFLREYLTGRTLDNP